MVGIAHAAPDDRLTCEKCHGFYAVEVPEDGTAPRVRCNTCGHIRELSVAPVQKEEEGKWTVIGPDGRSMTFGSWEKLIESRRPPASPHTASTAPGSGSKAPAGPDEKRLSASALLDITAPALPKLMLEDIESNPILPVATPQSSAESPDKKVTKSMAPQWAPVKTERKETLSTGKAPDKSDAAALDDDEPAPLSLRDAIPEEDETSPLSLRDAIQEDDDSSPLSLRDAIQEDDDPSDPHEMVSLQDVVLVASDDSAVDSTPHPPARGALRTLPPTPSRKGDAAPPPTINVEEERRQAEARAEVETARIDPKVVATKLDAKKKGAADKSAAAPPKRTETTKSKDERKAAPARAAVAEDEPTRGWLLPSVAIAAVAVVIWRIMVASPAKTATPAEPPPSVIVAAAPPEPTPTATATETSPQPEATISATPTAGTAAETTPTAPAQAATTTASAAPAASAAPPAIAATEKGPAPTNPAVDTDPPAATEKKAAPAAENGMSMSDLLDRAGSARRSGDLTTARELYERVIRQNPGNVEANGGLGDVARAQGDLNAAKSSYERALAASPSYGPAQLGLADTEWDLGNHTGAQRRYAQVVERLGNRAPERAKQRGVANE